MAFLLQIHSQFQVILPLTLASLASLAPLLPQALPLPPVSFTAGVFYRRCPLPPVSFTAGVLYRHSQINYFFSSTEMKCTLCQIAVQGSVKQFA
jgi:hypothetical protein